MSRGWISLYRKLQDNPLWTAEPFTRGQAWVDLLLLANHEDGFFYKRGIKIRVKRGQVAYSQKALSDRWQWSRGKVRRFLKDLEDEEQIVQQNNNVTTVFTIVNYSEYQKTVQQAKHQTDTKRTPNGHQTDTNNNVNNDNNVNKYTWVAENLSSVMSMENPLEEDEFSKLVEKYDMDSVEYILKRMDNWKPLTKKNKSAYLTADTWLRKNQKESKQEKEFNPEIARMR